VDIYFLNQFLFPIFIFLILVSILGYGALVNNYILEDNKYLHLKNIIFIKGLIFVGIINIFINLYFPISNLISIIIIIIGIILYFFFFLKFNNKKKELFFILFVLLLSFFYSFYAGFNDDYNYHYETIKNFKNKNLFEILHHRNISYNSHWLFLISIFSISTFTSTLFVISSLLYSISIYDFFNLTKSSIKNQKYYLSIICFFCLLFFLGVLNQMKDLGTDVPGVIVCIYIFLIIFYNIFEKQKTHNNNFFFTIFLFCQFAFVIKISNILIFLFLFFLLFKIKINTTNLLYIFGICLIPIPWLFQNVIISGCLIWPISLTCFANTDLAIHETYLIESFAKGDMATKMKINNFSWIYIWFVNHSSKIIETYLIYLFLLFSPFIYLVISKKYKFILIKNSLKEKYFNFNYFIILSIIMICNLIWFFYAPAYRFGIFYNLSFIIISLIPIWLFMIKYDSKFIYSYSKFILIFICLYFVYENISRIDWYLKRYDSWPPIYEEKLLERKNF